MPFSHAIEHAHAFEGGIVHWWTPEQRLADKPWLVFLPGLTADHRLFAPQIEHVDGSVNWLAWDAPSHGASRPHQLTWSYDDVARILQSILVIENIAAPILVGQSMGGYIAQVFMDLYPTEARGFISIDSCPLGRSYYTAAELACLRHTRGLLSLIPWKRLVNLTCDGCATTEQGKDLMRSMISVYGKREFRDLAAHGYRELARAVAADRAPEITCPTLLICGEKDAAESARRYNRAWSRTTGLPVHWIADAGHNSTIDNPAALNRLIEGFLGSLDAEQAGAPSR